MTTAAARRAYSGPALLSFGFRPFFLCGAAWSALAPLLWLWSLTAGGPEVFTRDWHVHEMLFGFLAAIVAGFLTTAVPNWTGRMPVIGAPLGLLFGLWIAGRVAMLTGPGPVAAVIDSAFLLAFAGVIWREVLAGRNWRNLGVCALVSLLATANIAFHLDAAIWTSGLGERLAIGAAATLIALIGGRITPSFTRNWMRGQGLEAPAPGHPRLDQAGLALTAAGAAAWALWPQSAAAGVLLVLAGAASLARLSRWGGLRTTSEPLVLVLHAGFAWLGLGLLLLGASVLTPEIARSAGVHALTTGAVGVMTLAVMTRATRGHTGRPLSADRATRIIYLCVNLAAAVRVAASFAGTAQPALLALSAVLWTAAFGGFALAYAPMLVRPRPGAVVPRG